jgi:hypothetical protein
MENGDQTVLMLALRQEVTFGGELRPRVYGCFRGSEGHGGSVMNRVGWTVSANSRQRLIQALPEHVLHYCENNHDNGTDHAPEDCHIRYYRGLCTCFA